MNKVKQPPVKVKQPPVKRLPPNVAVRPSRQIFPSDPPVGMRTQPKLKSNSIQTLASLSEFGVSTKVTKVSRKAKYAIIAGANPLVVSYVMCMAWLFLHFWKMRSLQIQM